MNKSLIKPINNEILKKKKKGFTLVELIIVIAIIAILAAIAIPKFGQVRQDAKVSNDIAAAKNIQSTVAMLVANGTIKEEKDITVDENDDYGKEIIKRIDGVTVPKAIKGENFKVKFDKGDVKVLVNGVTLAPADEDTTSEYMKKVNGNTDNENTDNENN
ncbi:prepilin-type N-terminal cleavage/methylation domain-containing protein [Clostridium weizhouense]|uniref:Prepilin-type N-terminal cleavage/methylation domain-containing protein n=1 Tax=Clostridium weizhouense TaxID=2859781 RepID=A0ABS7AQ48_9CLOT|nr:prepilin-type N-terminal cleavage/methylation domain-containing protein [Clostridium weizhouense]MBW6410203.1 prepilin-type N-terminal cleavage/methylation domain-containing protein [Clostridium weizhouense]